MLIPWHSRLLPRFSPTYISSLSLSATPPPVTDHHEFSVPSFGGKLEVNSRIPVNVVPACPQTFPNMDRAFVKAISNGDRPSLSVIQDEGTIQVFCPVPCAGSSLTAEVPMVHDADIATSGDAAISCSNMVESDFCNIQTEAGDVLVKGIKTERLKIDTFSGEVSCVGAVQGRVFISTGDGNVVGKGRFLGPQLEVNTDGGDINISSCYSDQSKFTTRRGSMELKNMHNVSNVEVTEEGNVTMQGLDGTTEVKVQKGSLDMGVSRVRSESNVEVVEGNVTLKLSPSHPLQLEVSAREIKVDSYFGKLGNVEEVEGGQKLSAVTAGVEGPLLHVVAPAGKVEVRQQSWAESIGLNMGAMGGLSKGGDLEGETRKKGSIEGWSIEDILAEDKEKK